MNWKTTAAGVVTFAVAAVPEILNYISANPGANWKFLALGVVGLIAGMLQKDHDATGGTRDV